MTGESVTDVGCSLRVMRTSFLRRVKLYRGMHRFLPDPAADGGGAGDRGSRVSIGRAASALSKYGNLDRLAAGIVDVFAVRWMQSRNERYRVDEWPRRGRGLDSRRRPAEGRGGPRAARARACERSQTSPAEAGRMGES